MKKEWNQPCVMALGMFDGLHIGHQALLAAAVKEKQRVGLPLVMRTFFTHPRNHLPHHAPVDLLMPNEEKKTIAEQLGVDYVMFEEFDSSFRCLSPEEFIQKKLKPHARCVVVGENYRFGYQHQGTPALLHQQEFSCILQPEIQISGVTVSSSQIRLFLQNGEISRATQFLGRPYSVTGRVISGEQRGRTWGIPTANLEISGQLLPRYGVYATEVVVDQKKYQAISNVGIKPTFGGTKPLIESWLFDFEENLYEKEITVLFHAFLRPETSFPDSAALQAQIRMDCQQAKEYWHSINQ